VHDDCYRVVSYYIEETAGAESKARVLDFYLRLMEPFFGLPERQHQAQAPREHAHHEVAADTDSEDGEGEDGEKPGGWRRGGGGRSVLGLEAAPRGVGAW
jgi:hypothetical protein